MNGPILLNLKSSLPIDAELPHVSSVHRLPAVYRAPARFTLRKHKRNKRKNKDPQIQWISYDKKCK